MVTVKLARESLQNALHRATLSPEEVQVVAKMIGDGARTVNVTLEVAKLPHGYLASLLHEPGLTPSLRAQISMRVHGISGDPREYQRLYDTVVTAPVEFASTFAALGMESPNCEYFINGRWYPIILGTHCSQYEWQSLPDVALMGTLSICDLEEPVYFPVSSHLFSTERGDPAERTVREVLQKLGLRPLMTAPLEHNLRLLNAERQCCETGRVVWITGSVLISNEYAWWNRTESRALGSKAAPRKAVIEPELEIQEQQHRYRRVSSGEGSSRLPFVRAFSLDTKRYVYVDVDDIEEYEFDTSAIDRLHLPDGMLSILTTVFTAPTEAIFGDVIAGKHGGMVVLASGKPGVGKTLTAEVYSELTERPLYVLELGELGTKATEVEENLHRVFTRVGRWNAVLQFDECEIFLARRGTDLERSAIVGIFLRHLDYYRGILFLTTNRPEVLDTAIVSRVTLHLQYPDLDSATRRRIWETMFNAAELSISSSELEALSAIDLNGRQIRNTVRLAKVVAHGRPIDSPFIRQLIEAAIPKPATKAEVEYPTREPA